MGVNEEYDTWAATYDTDRNLTRDLDEAVTREMLSPLRCAAILEIGCGTGKNTVFLAQIGTQVHALDFSEGMIARARAKLPLDNVTFTVADLTQPWPCVDESIDLIVCNLVLEHIADLSFVFAEASRCLAPSGHLFVCELHPFKQYMGAKATFERDDTRVEIPAFVHHFPEFLDAAMHAKLTLASMKEWWHDEDRDTARTPPRLVSFLFEK